MTSPKTPAIVIRKLVKHYRLGSDETGSFKSVVLDKIKRRKGDLLKVIDGIDLEIAKGEIVGICGANGAGKSTLLKMISGIVPPTSGEIRVEGRVASLLELGAGFHPEMTGVENVLLNGSIIGLPESFLREKMAAIFRTAGLERFENTPIKHYSSGMVQRLGFSIASHLDPDILILDEIFAVGDILFQRTALETFYNFKSSGKTILIVSHDLSIMEKFCDRVMILANSKILMDGPPKMVTHQYAMLSLQHRSQFGAGSVPYGVTNRGGDQRMRVENVRLLNPAGNETRAFRQFGSFRVRMTIANDDEDLGGPFISVRILDTWGDGVCQSILLPPEEHGSAPPRWEVELAYDPLLLSPGYYSVEVMLKTRGGWILDLWSYRESFHVMNREEHERPDIVTDGFFHHPSKWTMEGVPDWTFEQEEVLPAIEKSGA